MQSLNRSAPAACTSPKSAHAAAGRALRCTVVLALTATLLTGALAACGGMAPSAPCPPSHAKTPGTVAPAACGCSVDVPEGAAADEIAAAEERARQAPGGEDCRFVGPAASDASRPALGLQDMKSIGNDLGAEATTQPSSRGGGLAGAGAHGYSGRPGGRGAEGPGGRVHQPLPVD